MCWPCTMRPCGREAVFSGASWDATVSSPAKLRWSRNLKKDSKAYRSTSRPASEPIRRRVCRAFQALSNLQTADVKAFPSLDYHLFSHPSVVVRAESSPKHEM